MDNAIMVDGEHAVSCAQFSVRAEAASASGPKDPLTSRIELVSSGPKKDGSVSLESNGRVTAKVDEAAIDVVSSGVVIDSGDLGNVAARAGSAPAMQHIEMEGNGGSIILENGQIPLSPRIKIGVDSIELSVGLNKITIDAMGVSVSGIKVDVEGTADTSIKGLNVEVAADLAATVKGNASAELSAGVQTTVKGAMVMIN